MDRSRPRVARGTLQGLLLLALALLAACSGHQPLGSATSGEAASPSDGSGPAFPQGLEQRTISSGIVQTGAQALEMSNGASTSGQALDIPAGTTAPGYAIWGLDASGYEVSSFQTLITVTGSTEAWLGIADYAGQRWRFAGPYSTGAPVVICGNGDFTSTSQRAYIAVVARGTGSVRVSQIALGHSINLPETSGNLMWDTTRAQALALSQVEQYQELRQLVRESGDHYRGFTPPATTGWWQPHQHGTMALGVAWRLTGEDKYRSKLVKYLEHISNYSDLRGGRPGAEDLDLGVSLTNIAVTTNWLKGDLDGATLARLHALLFREAQYAAELLAERERLYFWNHSHFVATGLYAAACELEGYTPEAAGWRAEVEIFYEQMEDLLDQAGDGFYPEGCAYAGAVYFLLAEYRELRRSFGGSVPAHSWWRQLDEYFGCTLRPDMQQTLRIADDSGVWIYQPSAVLRYGAYLEKDGEMQALARHFQTEALDERDSFGDMIWQSAIFADPRVSTSALSLPARHEFADAGYFVQRSSWSAEADLLTVRAGLPGGASYNAFLGQHPADEFGELGHMHADQSSISWWVNGTCLLSDSGFEDLKLTNQHNTLSFGGRGQMGEAGGWWGWGWDWKPWGYGAEITTLETGQADYSVVETRADSAYVPATQMEQFRRRVIWFKPNLLLVQDRIELGKPNSIEANWLTQLGHWGGIGSQGSSDSLNLRVLGTQPGQTLRKAVVISSGNTAYRLQNIFFAPKGESRLLHVLWDNSQAQDWKLQSESGGVLRFTDATRQLEISVEGDHIQTRGYRVLQFSWPSL